MGLDQVAAMSSDVSVVAVRGLNEASLSTLGDGGSHAFLPNKYFTGMCKSGFFCACVYVRVYECFCGGCAW